MVFIRTVYHRYRHVAIYLRLSGLPKHGSRLLTVIWPSWSVQWAMRIVGKALDRPVLYGLLCSMVQLLLCHWLS